MAARRTPTGPLSEQNRTRTFQERRFMTSGSDAFYFTPPYVVPNC
jgi:hypothetical protein